MTPSIAALDGVGNNDDDDNKNGDDDGDGGDDDVALFPCRRPWARVECPVAPCRAATATAAL